MINFLKKQKKVKIKKKMEYQQKHMVNITNKEISKQEKQKKQKNKIK